MIEQESCDALHFQSFVYFTTHLGHYSTDVSHPYRWHSSLYRAQLAKLIFIKAANRPTFKSTPLAILASRFKSWGGLHQFGFVTSFFFWERNNWFWFQRKGPKWVRSRNIKISWFHYYTLLCNVWFEICRFWNRYCPQHHSAGKIVLNFFKLNF